LGTGVAPVLCSALSTPSSNPLPSVDADRLLNAAREAAKHAYAPYSKFLVGAAILLDDGRVFTGCNVENASYGLTICAERNAVFAAVTASKQPLRLRAVVVVTDISPPAMPCGACRQVLAEFAVSDLVVAIDGFGEIAFGELFPHPFRLR